MVKLLSIHQSLRLAVQMQCQCFHCHYMLVHALHFQELKHYSRDEMDATLAANQHELLATQQAFHAKNVQLEGQPPSHLIPCSNSNASAAQSDCFVVIWVVVRMQQGALPH